MNRKKQNIQIIMFYYFEKGKNIVKMEKSWVFSGSQPVCRGVENGEAATTDWT